MINWKANKTRKVLLSIFLVAIILIASISYIVTNRNTREIKHLKYKNYDIEYVQYSKGSKPLHPGHALYNEDLYKQAYMILANRLLDEYLRTKDTTLPREILRIGNGYNLDPSVRITNFDSLIVNRKTFLDSIILID